MVPSSPSISHSFHHIGKGFRLRRVGSPWFDHRARLVGQVGGRGATRLTSPWVAACRAVLFAAIFVKSGIVSKQRTNEKTAIAFCPGRDRTASRSRNGLRRAREPADRTFLSRANRLLPVQTYGRDSVRYARRSVARCASMAS